MTRSAISCQHVSKTVRHHAIVDDVSFEVAEGELFGFLGPNGAGKTSLMRMIVGLSKQSSGEIRVLGEMVPVSAASLSQIGSILEEPAFYPWMSGARNLRVAADSGRIPVSDGAIDRVLQRVGLESVARRKVKGYSQGMRQRLGLASALLRDPKVLVLDEPSNSLDPQGILDLRNLLVELRAEGRSVFLSSHQLHDVERMCDRVAVLDAGRLVAVCSPSELTGAGDGVRVRVRPDAQDRAIRALSSLVRSTVRVEGPGQLLVSSCTGEQVNAVLARQGIIADALTSDRSSLEDRFLSITGGGRESDATA